MGVDTLLGQSLQGGKYTLTQELGRGGFGITFRATHHLLNQEVVIKTLNEVLRHDPKFADFRQQFLAEARRLVRCVHPNIVGVNDFFEEDGLPFMVMDYIPGSTLAELIRPNRPLPEAIAIHYIRQIGAALGVVHQKGLLHRDVKPENIVLHQETREAILIDFGIAREFRPGVTQTHTNLISEGYAPIEQYLPQEKRTPATDVYGLAATLYTLLTGQVPVPSVLRDRQPLPPPRHLRPELSQQVDRAVTKGMAMEVRDRPVSVAAWLALLPGNGSESVSQTPRRSPGAVPGQAKSNSHSPANRPSAHRAVNEHTSATRVVSPRPSVAKTVASQSPTTKGKVSWSTALTIWTLTLLAAALGVAALPFLFKPERAVQPEEATPTPVQRPTVPRPGDSNPIDNPPTTPIPDTDSFPSADSPDSSETPEPEVSDPGTEPAPETSPDPSSDSTSPEVPDSQDPIQQPAPPQPPPVEEKPEDPLPPTLPETSFPEPFPDLDPEPDLGSPDVDAPVEPPVFDGLPEDSIPPEGAPEPAPQSETP